MTRRGLVPAALVLLCLTLPSFAATALSSSANPAILGSALTLTAFVTPASATGKVTFYLGTTIIGVAPLAGGRATYSSGLLPAGINILTARYGGDSLNPASISAPFIQRINANPANVLTPQSNFDVGIVLTSAAVTGDFNGDGKADIVVNSQSANLAVLLGAGNGVFQVSATVALPGTQALAAVDVDGDSKLDLLALQNNNVVAFLAGQGDGTFLNPVAVGSGGGHALAVADFDGDGRADFASGGSVYLGVGGGSFRLRTSGLQAGPAVAGDFNGDGKPDLAIDDVVNHFIHLFVGKGDGTFLAPFIVSAGQTALALASLTVADLNADGFPDLAVTNNNYVDVLLGKGDGTLQSPVSWLAGPSVTGLLSADFNGDGNPDIATFNASGAPAGLNILQGNGNGTFQAPQSYTGFGNPGALVVGDFNSDGITDIALAATGGAISVRLGAFLPLTVWPLVLPPAEVGVPWNTSLLAVSGTPPYSTWTVTTGALPPGLVLNASLGSITGTPTSVAGSPFSFGVTVRDSLGSASAAQTFSITVLPRVMIPPTSLPSGVVGSTYSTTLVASNGLPPYGNWTVVNGSLPPGLTLNGSTGTISGTPSLALVNPASFSVSVADSGGFVSAPQSLTLAVSSPAGPVRTPTSIALSVTPNPAGIAVPVTMTANLTPSGTVGKVTFYDGTTILGVRTLVAGQAQLTTRLLPTGNRKLRVRYQGDSTSQPSLSIPAAITISASPSNVLAPQVNYDSGVILASTTLVGDWNADGKLDLLINSQSQNLSMLLGNGDGTFRTASLVSVSGTTALASADMNGDGKQDLVALTTSGGVLVAMGNGDGTFQTALTVGTGGGAALALADFNGDGIADIASGGNIFLGKGDGLFLGPFSYATAGPVVAGDFNGDAIPDLAVNVGPGNVSILAGNGDGTFRTAVTWPMNISAGNTLIADDLDADGALDLVSVGNNTVVVLKGTGDGSFRSGLSFTAGASPAGVISADFDGDGKKDLATFNTSGAVAALNILSGNGDGSFQAARGFTGFGNPGALAAGDFNGDGFTDVAVVGTGGPVSVRLGLSTNLTIWASAIPSGSTGTFYTTSLLAIAGTPPYSNWTVTSGTLPPGLSLNASTGVISGTPSTNVGSPFAFSVTVRDSLGATSAAQAFSIPVITRVSVVATTLPSAVVGLTYSVPLQAINGLPPYVTWAIVSGSLPPGLTLNTATGVISGTPTLALVNAASFSAAVTDSGGFVSASQSFSIAVAAAPGPATVATTTSLSAAPTTATLGSPFTLTATVSPAAASGKVTFYDGSAILGYAALSGGTATIITRQLPAGARSLRVRYPGDATYLPSASSPLPGTTVNTAVANVLTSRADYPSGVIISASAVAGDFNGDQKTDLVIGSQSQNLGVLLGNGDGTFRSGGQYALSANSWVSAGDFNGDGKLDLVILRSGTIVVAQGNGDGTFQSPVSIGTGGGSIAVADFNNDGKADLASAGSIFLGLGDATFLGPFALAATGPVTAGDFNGDGTADLAVNNGNLVILLGNGDGTFQNVATYSTAVAAQTPFTAVDFNGDGRLDLVGVANNQVSVASGNGNGTFQPAKLFAAGESPAGLTTSDFNGDGFPDIATFNIAGATAGMNLLLGNGDGTFQAVKPYSGFINPGALVAGEFNGDGRADIALVTTGGPVTVLLGRFLFPLLRRPPFPRGKRVTPGRRH